MNQRVPLWAPSPAPPPPPPPPPPDGEEASGVIVIDMWTTEDE